MNLPDLLRARRTWLTPSRLIIGGILGTALAAGAALLSIGPDAGRSLTVWVLLLQSVVLFFYGVPAAVNDFVEEHRNNTWDMLRLTPLTAAELVLGRILASTSYAVYLAAVVAPWAVFAQGLDSAPGYLTLFALWVALLLGFVAASTTGVAAAALATRLQGGKVGNTGLAMGGLTFLVSGLVQTLAFSPREETVTLIVGTVPAYLWATLGLALWAAWASAASVRMVGRLLSERQTDWALPAFLVTLWAYFGIWLPQTGASGPDFALGTVCLTAPAVVALMASFAEGEDAEDWKTKLRAAEKRRSLAPLVPGWGAAWLTVTVLAALTAAARPETARIAVLVSVFLARDLMLLSTLRALLKRNVETAAVAVLGTVYILPVIYLTAVRDLGALYYLVPMESDKVGALANIMPGAAQALAAAILFWGMVRRLRREDRLLR